MLLAGLNRRSEVADSRAEQSLGDEALCVLSCYSELSVQVRYFGAAASDGSVVEVSLSGPNVRRASAPETAYGCTGGKRLCRG